MKIPERPKGYNNWRELVMTRRRNRVHSVVKQAIIKGNLPHPSTLECVDCGKPASCYDHRDYAKPLDVSAVCKKCDCARGVGHPYYEIKSKQYLVLLDEAKTWYVKNQIKKAKIKAKRLSAERMSFMLRQAAKEA